MNGLNTHDTPTGGLGTGRVFPDAKKLDSRDSNVSKVLECARSNLTGNERIETRKDTCPGSFMNMIFMTFIYFTSEQFMNI
jgi:hypothetical protein